MRGGGSRKKRKRRKKTGTSSSRSRKALPVFAHDDITEFLDSVKTANSCRHESARYPEIGIGALKPRGDGGGRVIQVFEHDVNDWILSMERRAPRIDLWYRSVPGGHYNPLVKISLEGACTFDMLYVARSERQRNTFSYHDDDDDAAASHDGGDKTVRERCTQENKVNLESDQTYVLALQQPIWVYYMDACLDILLEKDSTTTYKLFHLEPQCDISDMTLQVNANLLDPLRLKALSYSIRQHHGPSSWLSVHIKAECGGTSASEAL